MAGRGLGAAVGSVENWLGGVVQQAAPVDVLGGQSVFEGARGLFGEPVAIEAEGVDGGRGGVGAAFAVAAALGGMVLPALIYTATVDAVPGAAHALDAAGHAAGALDLDHQVHRAGARERILRRDHQDTNASGGESPGGGPSVVAVVALARDDNHAPCVRTTHHGAGHLRGGMAGAPDEGPRVVDICECSSVRGTHLLGSDDGNHPSSVGSTLWKTLREWLRRRRRRPSP